MFWVISAQWWRMVKIINWTRTGMSSPGFLIWTEQNYQRDKVFSKCQTFSWNSPFPAHKHCTEHFGISKTAQSSQSPISSNIPTVQHKAVLRTLLVLIIGKPFSPSPICLSGSYFLLSCSSPFLSLSFKPLLLSLSSLLHPLSSISSSCVILFSTPPPHLLFSFLYWHICFSTLSSKRLSLIYFNAHILENV